MQAVILAGGLGTRLWPITKEIPKPMVPILGRPYLEYQVEELRGRGILDIVLLTGYLGEQIESHFGNGSSFGVEIRYSREFTPIGTGGALRLAKTILAPEFLLLYGDSFLPIDYANVLSRLIETGKEGLLAVYDNSAGDTSVVNNVALASTGLVARYEKDTGHPDLHYVEAGVLAFRRNAIQRIPADRPCSLEKEIFPQLIAEHDMASYVTIQRFFDIGTPSRLDVVSKYFAAKGGAGEKHGILDY